MSVCAIYDCDEPVRSRGWCQLHYGRFCHTGKPQGHTPRDRFLRKLWSNIDVGHPAGCWEWTGSIAKTGYGQISIGARGRRRVLGAHRVVYQQLVGPIRSDAMDHLCRNTICVNPDHLEPVTHAENILRGYGFSAKNARKIACPAGHPYVKANLVRGEYGRKCKVCHAAREAARRASKRKAAA